MQPLSYVALLRGINVGGKNKLPMRHLLEMFAALKCRNIRAYIQSGNIVFDAAPKIAVGLPEKVSALINKQFGYKIPIVLRTAAQLQDTVDNNPFLKTDATGETLHVMFLKEAPDLKKVAGLDVGRSIPDEFSVRGGEIYLRLPNGAGRTKLTTTYFDTRLATIGTGRNWRTVTTLLEMMRT